MMNKFTRLTFTLLMLALVTALGTSAFASDLKENFKSPPEATKPWCYWYWLAGDISKEGITKDLENMAEVTLNGKTYDTLWMPPFELDVTDALKTGTNKLAVRVTSTTEGKPKMSETLKLKVRAVKPLKKQHI